MSKSIVILLLYFLVAVYAPDPLEQDPETYVNEPPVKDLPSVELLAKIKREEVLPLIAFTNTRLPEREYQKPEKLLKYKLTDDGEIANGTKFEARNSGDQILFCPRENTSDKCLARQTFAASAPLRCASEPTPQWEEMPGRCGDGNGRSFKLVYKICEDNTIDSQLTLSPKRVSFYEICYDTELHRIVYTDHEVWSPELLDLNLLAQERSMDYPTVISEDPLFIGHPISEDVLAQGTTSLENPSYELQEIVPPEDMAFATWRKTTFNNLNYDWQHKTLTNVWDEISRDIRSVVKNYTTSINHRLFVNTAIVDVSYSLPEDDKQLPNIWVKMVTVFDLTFQKERITHGIVILMNNFIDKSNSSDVRNAPLKKYCVQDLCINELTQKINNMGGGIRCCPITTEISLIFHFGEIEGEIPHNIPIPNVTIADQTFEDIQATSRNSIPKKVRKSAIKVT